MGTGAPHRQGLAAMGPRIQRDCDALQVTVRQLGVLLQVSPSTAHRILRGERIVRLEEVRILDRAWQLSGPASLEAAWHQARRETENPTTTPPTDGAALSADDAGPGPDAPSTPGSPVDRRSFLADLPALYLTASAPALDPGRASRADPARELAAALETAATEIAAVDHAQGGGRAVRHDAVARLTHGATRVAALPAAQRPRVLGALGRLGCAVGAAHFDAYDHAAARAAWRLAATCADEAEDWFLYGKVCSWQARHAVWLGRPEVGAAYARRGLAYAYALTPTMRAMLHCAAARAAARRQDITDTIDSVRAADEAFAAARPGDDPVWMRYFDHAQLQGDTGHALFDLAVHRHDATGQARTRLEGAVAGHTDAYARSRAISLTKLATLDMAVGDRDQAADLGAQALHAVAALGSARAVEGVRELQRAAAAHPSTAARELTLLIGEVLPDQAG